MRQTTLGGSDQRWPDVLSTDANPSGGETMWWTRAARALSVALLIPMLLGCSSGTSSGATAAGQSPKAAITPAIAAPTAAPGQMVGVLPSTDLAVGKNNRFQLGLLDDTNRPVHDARVRLIFVKLVDATNGQVRGFAEAPFRGSPQLGDKGLYVARVDFDEPGRWGVEVQATRPNLAMQTLRLTFEVLAQSRTPAIGSSVPASQTPVAATPSEAEQVCSARPADDFHRLSIADALGQRKPLVVLFATPAFCATRTCGPSLEVVQLATAAYADRLNVVHVEIYKDGRPPDLVPAVAEWSLTTEPWVFLVDADGKVADKFEGGITLEELQPAVTQLVTAS